MANHVPGSHKLLRFYSVFSSCSIHEKANEWSVRRKSGTDWSISHAPLPAGDLGRNLSVTSVTVFYGRMFKTVKDGSPGTSSDSHALQLNEGQRLLLTPRAFWSCQGKGKIIKCKICPNFQLNLSRFSTKKQLVEHGNVTPNKANYQNLYIMFQNLGCKCVQIMKKEKLAYRIKNRNIETDILVLLTEECHNPRFLKQQTVHYNSTFWWFIWPQISCKCGTLDLSLPYIFDHVLLFCSWPLYISSIVK